MKRRGFTLIELLIVLSILIILFTLVVSVYQSNQGTDRMRSAARQLQSAILGARDRAIHAKAPRGLRLIVDSADPSTVTSFSYIRQLDAIDGTQCTLRRPDTDNNGSADSDTPRYLYHTATISPTWVEYYNQGLLRSGNRIRLSATGSWYTIDTSQLAANKEVLVLTSDFKSPPAIMPAVIANSIDSYKLELAAAPLQGEQPIALPSACVIDLDNSRIPGGWWDASTGKYSLAMDIMFSPRGTITGPLAAQGIIHLLLAETADTTLKMAAETAPTAPFSSSLHKSRLFERTVPPECTQGEKLIVTVFTRTGAVSTHPVDTIAALHPVGTLTSDPAYGKAGVAGTDDDSDTITDADTTTGLPDPEEIGYGDDNPRERYRFAETGSAAGK